MVSNAVFLAAIIVPPVCVLCLVLYSLAFYFRLLRPAGQTHVIRDSVSYPVTTQLPPLVTVLRPTGSSPFPLSGAATVPAFSPTRRAPLPPFDPAYAPPPVPPPPSPEHTHASPAESRFAIATTISRTGSRVLARNPSSNNSHGTQGTSKSGSSGSRSAGQGGKRAERRASRPEKARKVKGQHGIGDGDEERVHDDTVIVDITGSSPPSLRRRNSTWTAQDLEQVVGRAVMLPHRPSPASPPNRESSAQRPSLRPLPPGAGHGSNGGAPSDETGDGFGSQESGAALLAGPAARQVDGETTEELERAATWTERNEIIVRDLRELRGRPQQPSAPLAPDERVDYRLSAGSSLYANSADELTLSAHSTLHHAYFSTSVLPLPPPSPSASARHSPLGEPVSGWSASSHNASDPHLSRASSLQQQPPYPLQLTPTYPSFRGTTPPFLSNPRVSQASVTSTSMAFEDGQHYAFCLPSPMHTLPRVHENSAPWFAEPAASEEEAREELADLARAEDIARRETRRPISWMMRQESNGTLPDMVPAVGDFVIVNPDERSVRTSTSSVLSG
ncbi:hypothetical protein JCM10213v2_004780 [Rhodosporidiobolus nylandii]